MHADLQCRNMPLPNLKEKKPIGVSPQKNEDTRATPPAIDPWVITVPVQDVLSDLDHRMLEAGRQDRLEPQSGLASRSSSRGVAKKENTKDKKTRRP